MFVAIKIVGAGVIRDVQIGPAVVFEIRPQRLHAESVPRIVDSRFLRNLFKSTVAAIMEQQVGLTRKPIRPAQNADSKIVAGRAVVVRFRQRAHILVHIARNKKIDVPIAIVISPCGAGAKPASVNTSRFRHIFKLTVPHIAVENIPAVACNVNVLPAVVVEIGDGNAHSPTLACKPGGAGDVGEFETSVLMIEGNHGIATAAEAGYRRTVDGDDVELAIIVAVDETDPAAGRLHDVKGIG